MHPPLDSPLLMGLHTTLSFRNNLIIRGKTNILCSKNTSLDEKKNMAYLVNHYNMINAANKIIKATLSIVCLIFIFINIVLIK